MHVCERECVCVCRYTFKRTHVSNIPGGGQGSPLQYLCPENATDEEPSRPWSIESQSQTRLE